MAKKFGLFLILLFLIALGTSAQSKLTAPPKGGLRDGNENPGEMPLPEPDSAKVKIKHPPYYFKINPDNLDTFHVAIDTSLHGTHIYSPMYKRSISNNTLGNLGSPYISNIYFDRPQSDFLFSDVYDVYYKNYNTIPYINTQTPFTILSYNTGGPKRYAEDNISVLFSQNINKDMNVGGYYDLVYGRGRYDSQSTRHKNYGGFYSYNSNKYNAYFNIGSNVMENFENGGFGTPTAWDDSYITDPTDGVAERPQNYDVRIDEATSRLKTNFITLSQNYNLGVTHEVEKNDTTIEENFVSVLNLVHKFKYEVNTKKYKDDDAVTTFYDTTYINRDESRDEARRRRVSNSLGVYLDEGINKYGKFGIGAYIQMDNDYITNRAWETIQDTSWQKDYSEMMKDDTSNYVITSDRWDYCKNYSGYKYTNTTFGGSLFKREGTHFFYDASGKICLSGYNLGDWQLKGVAREVFPKWGKMEISGRAEFSRKTPDYFLNHYHANNFWWDNDFNAEFSQKLGGTISIPSYNFRISLDIDNMQNKVYFNQEALPDQSSDNIAVMAVRLEKDFEIGKHLVWENDLIYQETSNENVLPLPKFSGYTNLYLRGVYAKVLHFEIGADCRYHSSYYAPGYMPATGRFYNQRDVKVGDYPVMNVYADFFLKRMRFFVMYQHVNQGWPNKEYFSAPHYAYNPRMFKYGLQWTFYD